MQIRPLVVGVLFEAYGLWKFVMDVLGDADILRTLTDRTAWLHSYAPILIGLALIAWTFWPRGNKKAKPMSISDNTVVGLDIQNSNGGIGMDIESDGTLDVPSSGGEAIVYAEPGQSAIGTRVVQNGPGIGMRVVQSGPGVGFRSVVVVGGKPTDK